MRKPDGSDPPPPTHQTLDLTIEVLAAQNLPLPPDDTHASSFRPYLKVEIHTSSPDEHHAPASDSEPEGEYKARTLTGRGVNPDFGGEALRFGRVSGVVPELAFLRFTVRDDEFARRDDLAGWACVRLDRVRSGYRVVRLLGCGGEATLGVVLVKISKNLV